MSIDDILTLIDAGLGSSFEHPGDYFDFRDYCWRCQDRPATERMDGACEACASWLLGEGEDPLEGPRLEWSDVFVEHMAASPIALTRLEIEPGVYTLTPGSHIYTNGEEFTIQWSGPVTRLF